MVGAFLVLSWWNQYGADARGSFLAPGHGALASEPVVRWSFSGRFEALAPIADADGDGEAEVFAYERDSGVYLLEGSDGLVNWFRPYTDYFGAYNHPLMGDVDGDGEAEPIYMDEDTSGGNFKLAWRALRGSSGAQKWFVSDTAHRNEFTVSKLGDIDGDGLPEALLSFPTEAITAVDGDGTVLWQFEIGEPGGSAIGDVDGDGENEVVVFHSDTGGRVYVLSGDGSVEDSFKVVDYSDYRIPPTLADVDGDGVLEIALVGPSGYYVSPGVNAYVRVFDYSGGSYSELWSYYNDTSYVYFYQAMAGDLDGDGLPDIVALSRGDSIKRVVAFKGTDGTVLWRAAFPVYAGNVGYFTMGSHTGALADVDGDAKLEVLVPAEFVEAVDSTSTDTLYCLNGEDGSVLWKKPLSADIHSVSVGDVDGDGLLEVVVPLYHEIVVLDNESLYSGEKERQPWNLRVTGLRGGIAFESASSAQVFLYFEDGRLIKNLRLQPGRTFVPLKAGVYFWKAGKRSGKAVVKP